MNIFQNNILCCFEKDSQRIKTSLRLPFSLSLSCLAVGTADWWAQTRITLQRTASYMRCIGRFGLIPMTFVILVGSSGLEPPTSRLSGARSNHLSYEPMLVFGVSRSSRTVYVTFSLRWWRWWGSNPWPPACRAGALPAELHPHIMRLFNWVKCEEWRASVEKLRFPSFCALHSSKVTQNWTTIKTYCTSAHYLAVFLVFAYFQTTTDQTLCIYLSRSP